MRKQIAQLQIVGAVLWAAAMVAGAMEHAPAYFTLGLLPLLATMFMAAVEIIGRQEKRDCVAGMDSSTPR